MSSTTSLKDLPFELLQLISEYLESHIPSLRSFGQVNRNCHTAATSVSFRKIVIHQSTSSWLRRDVQTIRSVLSSIGYETVRRLDVRGALEKPFSFDLPKNGEVRPLPMEVKHDHSFKGDQIGSNEDDELSVFSHAMNPARPDSLENHTQGTYGWQILIDLIVAFPALSDCVWSCLNDCPWDLLIALAERLPSCRLHLRTFRWQQSGIPSIALERYINVLLRSPNLNSVWQRPCHTLPGGMSWGTRFCEDVARLASNLKELRPLLLPCRGNMLFRWHQAEPAEFRDLERLDLTLPTDVDGHRCYNNCELDTLEQWRRRVDFTTLKTIRFTKIERNGLLYLKAHGQFHSLKTLIFSPRSVDFEMDTEQFGLFLASLPPLSALHLPADTSRVAVGYVKLVMQHHGRSLRRLWFDQPDTERGLHLNLTFIEELRSHCPLLEDLKVTINRTRGDETELSIYRALGRMPKLRTVSLVLDCQTPGPRAFALATNEVRPVDNEPFRDDQFDEFDSRVYAVMQGARDHTEKWIRYGHVKYALVNAAVDETLASSFWDMVNRAEPAGSRPLERLVLKSVNTGEFDDTRRRAPPGEVKLSGCPKGWQDCFVKMRRTWPVEPNPRDDMVGSVVVSALEPDLGRYCCFVPQENLSRVLRVVMESLWPAMKDRTVDWQTAWHSFPLSGS